MPSPVASNAHLMLGDCIERMAEIPDASVDAIVTDPPAGIGFMGKEWDDFDTGKNKGYRESADCLNDHGFTDGGNRLRTPTIGGHSGNPTCRKCRRRQRTWKDGPMACQCESPDMDMGKKVHAARDAFVGFLAPRMAQAYRIAKPGSYALVWALPRTSHWTATAIEDGGWTIRDRVTHLFGTGFPKAKSCLKPGAEDWWLAYKPGGKMSPLQIESCRIDGSAGRWPANVVLSHSPECRLVGARKVKGDPRTGGEGTRPGGFLDVGSASGDGKPSGRLYGDEDGTETVEAWECVEDCAVAALDSQSGIRTTGWKDTDAANNDGGRSIGKFKNAFAGNHYQDSGGASRFFYTAKASRSDRGPDNDHPTVKSESLMRWLCRLITPPGGTIADPFMGSGSTGKAARLEGFCFVGIERDPGYFAIAERRIADAQAATPLFGN